MIVYCTYHLAAHVSYIFVVLTRAISGIITAIHQHYLCCTKKK